MLKFSPFWVRDLENQYSYFYGHWKAFGGNNLRHVSYLPQSYLSQKSEEIDLPTLATKSINLLDFPLPSLLIQSILIKQSELNIGICFMSVV